MTPGTVLLLVLSSAVNGTLGFGAFLFAAFATTPDTSDATMRAGFYVLHGIVAAAAVGAVAPWVLAWREQRRAAVVIAILPAVLAVLAVVAFLLLDSWIRQTFGG